MRRAKPGSDHATPDSPRRTSLLRERSGAVYAEYLTVLVLVTLVGSLAIVSVGPSLLLTFRFAELMVAAPYP